MDKRIRNDDHEGQEQGEKETGSGKKEDSHAQDIGAPDEHETRLSQAKCDKAKSNGKEINGTKDEREETCCKEEDGQEEGCRKERGEKGSSETQACRQKEDGEEAGEGEEGGCKTQACREEAQDGGEEEQACRQAQDSGKKESGGQEHEEPDGCQAGRAPEKSRKTPVMRA